MSKTVKIDLRVTPVLKGIIAQRAEQEGRTVSGLILFAMRQYLEEK